MAQVNFVMVRSPKLIENNQIGYGWASVNFSQFETVKDLIDQ
ncbi:hypothetical protein [Psychrobacter sp. NPDC078761]